MTMAEQNEESDLLLIIDMAIKSCGKKRGYVSLHLAKHDPGRIELLPTISWYSGQCSDNLWNRQVSFSWLRWFLSVGVDTIITPAGWPTGPLPHERDTTTVIFSGKTFTMTKETFGWVDLLPRIIVEQEHGKWQLAGGWWKWWLKKV